MWPANTWCHPISLWKWITGWSDEGYFAGDTSPVSSHSVRQVARVSMAIGLKPSVDIRCRKDVMVCLLHRSRDGWEHRKRCSLSSGIRQRQQVSWVWYFHLLRTVAVGRILLQHLVTKTFLEMQFIAMLRDFHAILAITCGVHWFLSVKYAWYRGIRHESVRALLYWLVTERDWIWSTAGHEGKTGVMRFGWSSWAWKSPA